MDHIFVGAIANYLMMVAAPEKVNFAEMKRREDWLTNGHGRGGPGGNFFTGLTVGAIVDAFAVTFRLKDPEPVAVSALLDHENTVHAEKITSGEADWLVKALQADGKIDANERALLEFIREECPAIDATLKPLLDAA